MTMNATYEKFNNKMQELGIPPYAKPEFESLVQRYDIPVTKDGPYFGDLMDKVVEAEKEFNKAKVFKMETIENALNRMIKEEIKLVFNKDDPAVLEEYGVHGEASIRDVMAQNGKRPTSDGYMLSEREIKKIAINEALSQVNVRPIVQIEQNRDIAELSRKQAVFEGYIDTAFNNFDRPEEARLSLEKAKETLEDIRVFYASSSLKADDPDILRSINENADKINAEIEMLEVSVLFDEKMSIDPYSIEDKIEKIIEDTRNIDRGDIEEPQMYDNYDLYDDEFSEYY